MNEVALYNILRAPRFTEKSTRVTESDNTYVFEVERTATKAQIKEAINKVFRVEVIGVTTLQVKGKKRRTRLGIARQRHWKKAYIRVAEGKTIDLSRAP